MKFSGTKAYVATDDLTIAVNASITLERPLLVKGEPGTGKTELAKQISQSLNLRMIEWNIKSTTKAQQGLYEYDAVTRLRDSQLGDERVKDVKNYIKKGKLWEAFEAKEKVVLMAGNMKGVGSVNGDGLVAPAAEAEVEYYTIQSGDTLWAIASKFLGNGSKYPEIFEANREVIEDPDKIFPGQKIRIPK